MWQGCLSPVLRTTSPCSWWPGKWTLCQSITRWLAMMFYCSGGMLTGSCILQPGLFCSWLSLWLVLCLCCSPKHRPLSTRLHDSSYESDSIGHREVTVTWLMCQDLPISLAPWLFLSTIYSWTLDLQQKTKGLLLPSFMSIPLHAWPLYIFPDILLHVSAS